jgi:hypothetical protein
MYNFISRTQLVCLFGIVTFYIWTFNIAIAAGAEMMMNQFKEYTGYQHTCGMGGAKMLLR